MNLSVLFALVLAHFTAIASSLTYTNIAFVILSQHHPYHTSLAEQLKKEIIIQAYDFQQRRPQIWITHLKGSWVVLPLLEKLAHKYSSFAEWVVFCDPHISLNLANLYEVLKRYDSSEEIWIGHGLHDIEPTIIHHFATMADSDEFLYPNMASGFAMSMALLRTLYHRFKENDTKAYTEFSIDASFELAKFIWDNGEGSMLTHDDQFCVVSNKVCATYPKSYDACGDAVSRDEVLFAVKTYHKFHDNRVVIVKNTWGKFASNLIFFSDITNNSIPTIDVGVANTERGHCSKTIAILKYALKYFNDNKSIRWIMIADDDTILSVSRLCEVLSCYGDKHIALGERYGFNIITGDGYDYLTGGGGLVLSKDLVYKLADCNCPMPSTPDDMWIGVCLAKLKIPVIHSPLFHQARPVDYALEYLAPHRPVSFHKHWMIDPVDVYKRWFRGADSKLREISKTEQLYHNEL